jgi:hypothetical protein
MVGFELPTIIAFLLFCIGVVLIFAESRVVPCGKKADKRGAAIYRHRLLQNLLR